MHDCFCQRKYMLCPRRVQQEKPFEVTWVLECPDFIQKPTHRLKIKFQEFESHHQFQQLPFHHLPPTTTSQLQPPPPQAFHLIHMHFEFSTDQPTCVRPCFGFRILKPTIKNKHAQQAIATSKPTPKIAKDYQSIIPVDHFWFFFAFKAFLHPTQTLQRVVAFVGPMDEPEWLLCPLTGVMFREPVVNLFGNTYERDMYCKALQHRI